MLFNASVVVAAMISKATASAYLQNYAEMIQALHKFLNNEVFKSHSFPVPPAIELLLGALAYKKPSQICIPMVEVLTLTKPATSGPSVIQTEIQSPPMSC